MYLLASTIASIPLPIMEVTMNKQDCVNERISSRTVGFVLLLVSMVIGFVGSLVLPNVGLFFAVPILLWSFAFLAMPQSKICRMILNKGA